MRPATTIRAPSLRSGRRFGSWLSALSVIALAAGGGADLTKEQRDLVDRGELAVVQQERHSSPWPAMTIYVFINATPEEAAAVFMDYEAQVGYVPSMRKARISKVIDAATVEVDYVLAIPMFPDEEYTVRDHISVDSAGYRVHWNLVRASSARGTVGHALFKAHRNAITGKQGTLLEYFNFVTPGSRLAGVGFVKRRAMGEVLETVRAVQREVERDREAADMPRRLAALRAALGR